MGKIESGSVKTRDAVKSFHLFENARFSPGYEGTENMFYFFNKIITFCLNKEKDDIRSAYVYLNFFHETVTSHKIGRAHV